LAKLVETVRVGNQLQRWYAEGKKVWYVVEDLDRAEILELNRQALGNLKSVDGMKWALSIPPDDMFMLKQRFPDLDSLDRDIKHKAWQKFMKTSESEPFRVYQRSKRGATA